MLLLAVRSTHLDCLGCSLIAVTRSLSHSNPRDELHLITEQRHIIKFLRMKSFYCQVINTFIAFAIWCLFLSELNSREKTCAHALGKPIFVVTCHFPRNTAINYIMFLHERLARLPS